MLPAAIHNFRQAGYEVWMDDFGSGYSSLNYLKNFEFDEIKLDMIFMKDFDEASKKILIACVKMAKDLGIHTLAEGVETKQKLDFLQSIGCERIQSFYYSKPLPTG
ncbi:EAL domain-containing protein [Lactobacillus delbrueckii subsp. lactis DSM 20072]|nr:EAL domain-containing protein [Lactobacillus delbrueckii]ASW11385.1 EAL domain-containing protein [Lactobacillus delbrueckii subsp. lactis DSM 20072]KRK65544.1 EAL domain-containing protein [Lactobacillus delbrueckii subsp. lactis DSM 20072]MCT3500233.1 EAL domain-containing protein [Lactobacillus delbrueckii subsp. lactis]